MFNLQKTYKISATISICSLLILLFEKNFLIIINNIKIKIIINDIIIKIVIILLSLSNLSYSAYLFKIFPSPKIVILSLLKFLLLHQKHIKRIPDNHSLVNHLI